MLRTQRVRNRARRPITRSDVRMVGERDHEIHASVSKRFEIKTLAVAGNGQRSRNAIVHKLSAFSYTAYPQKLAGISLASARSARSMVCTVAVTGIWKRKPGSANRMALARARSPVAPVAEGKTPESAGSVGRHRQTGGIALFGGKSGIFPDLTFGSIGSNGGDVARRR